MSEARRIIVRLPDGIWGYKLRKSLLFLFLSDFLLAHINRLPRSPPSYGQLDQSTSKNLGQVAKLALWGHVLSIPGGRFGTEVGRRQRCIAIIDFLTKDPSLRDRAAVTDCDERQQCCCALILGGWEGATL